MKLKKLISIILSVLLLIAVIPLGTFTASADTSGYYTYSVYSKKATITDVDTSISGNITIPDKLGGYLVTSIGYYAFENCTGLTSVTIGNSVTSIGSYAFEGCTGLTSVTIGNSVTSIDYHAFYGCTGLTSITIPDSVISISDWAFSDCTGLTSVTIGKCVSSITYRAFEGCTRLTSVTISNSATSIGSYAFEGCAGLTSITIPDSVISIGDWAFRDCTGLTSVTIGNCVSSIGDSAFYGCKKLTSITLPDSVTSIGGSAFYGCSILKTVTMPSRMTSDIPEYLFYKCIALKKIDIPYGVTSIGEDAFSNCLSLESVEIPDGVTYIGSGAFNDCSKLKSVTLPNSIVAIDEFSFSGCENITDVYYIGTELQKDDIVFGNFNYYLLHATWHYQCEHEGGIATCARKAICSQCGEEYGEFNPSNHLGSTDVRGERIATCTENGYTGDTYCLDCGEKIETGETISALGHSFGDWIVITNPTCTEKGVEKRVCSHDNSHTETRNINALGHKYNAVITTPTCTEQGYTTYTCSRCGNNYKDDYVAALGHIGGTATCHNKAICNRCGREYGGFNYTNHTGGTEIRGSKPATCAEIGYTGDTYCVGCGTKIKTGTNVPTIDHKYQWKVTRLATENNVGLKEEICSVCGHKSGNTIEMIYTGHITGDTNGDSAVDNKDLTRLFQYLSNWDVEVSEAALDVNGDNSVDNKDLTRLFQYLSNWDVEIY